MDAKHLKDMHEHLEKQNELLMEAYRSMSHELHRLQVEEEMLMHKYFEFMLAQGIIEKDTNNDNLTRVNENDEANLTVVNENDEAGV